MYKRTRKHSALLLFLAPVIAIGSSALVAGTAASAGATVKKVASPTINICEVAPGAFRFALNGTAVSFRGSCGKFTAKIGLNHVTEVSAPAIYRSLSSISVSPLAAEVSSSLRTDTVSVRLLAGRSATVKFANEKLVVVVPSPTPVTPPPSSPSPSSPPPSSPPPGNPGPGSPPVSNPVSTGTTGYIEVCKTALDPMVEGPFSFTIAEGTTTIGTYTLTLVPPGTTYTEDAPQVCTSPIQVPAGTVTVTEGLEGPGYALYAVEAAPTAALGTYNLTTQTANFTVTAGLETTANFVNETVLNSIKVCKVLVNNLGVLAGTTFDYNVAWVFSPPNGATPISGNTTVWVAALAAPGEACSISEGIPAGSAVTVTETGSTPASYVSVSNVAIVPPQFNNGTTSTSTDALLTVPPVTEGFADAVFTNDPMGYVEVCKYFDGGISGILDASLSDLYNKYNSATFTVNGGAPFTVQGGHCSGPIEVPAGTATVSEASLANFYLDNVTASSVVSLPLSELQSLPSADPAVVTVPYGSVGNETTVKFYDTVDPTQWKICLQETSPDANLGGLTATFGLEFASPLVADDATEYGIPGLGLEILPDTTLDPTAATGLYCTDQFNGPPVVDPWGDPYNLTISQLTASGVSETATVTSIVYQGNGSAGSPTLGIPPEDGITVTAGAGVNVVTFTDGRTGPS